MARSDRKLQRIKDKQLKTIEKKYGKIIKDTLNEYNDKTMQELWERLDVIKAEMKQEMELLGLNETNGHYMDW